jgi:hypothetical protein
MSWQKITMQALGTEFAVVSFCLLLAVPGGFVPDWLAVKMTDRYIQQVIAAVAQRLGQTN